MIAISKIISNVKKELGSFFSTEAHTDVDILRYINSAARATVLARNFGFNKYTQDVTVLAEGVASLGLVGTYEGTVGTNITIPYQIETFFILDSSGDEVDIVSFEDYYRESDKTDLIMIEEDKLVCTKPGTYTIYYRGYIPTVTAVDGTLEIPEHFFDLIVLKATYYGLMDIRAYEKAAFKEGIYKGMIGDVSKRESDKKPLVRKRLNKSKNNIF